ncbi:MAG: hypothetical protein ACK4OJ_02580 [Brevundimonas sp.]|jgi:hypothetical protein
MSKIIWSAVLGLALAGCASAPTRVTTTGDTGRLAASTRFNLSLAQPASENEVVAAHAVTERLTACGWTQAADNPELILEIGYVAPPRALGVYAGDERPDTSDGWLEIPTPKRWWSRSSHRHALTARLIDPTTGQTVLVSTAAMHSDGRANTPVTALADALAVGWTQPACGLGAPQAVGSSTPKAEPSGPLS